MSDLDKLNADIEAAWTAYYDYRQPLRIAFEDHMRETAGYTGVGPSPGVTRLLDDLVAIVADNPAVVEKMAGAYGMARLLEARRTDEVEGAPTLPEKAPPFLLHADDDEIRTALGSAAAVDVLAWLGELDNPEDRRAYALALYDIARADGNRHEVLEVLAKAADPQSSGVEGVGRE